MTHCRIEECVEADDATDSPLPQAPKSTATTKLAHEDKLFRPCDWERDWEHLIIVIMIQHEEP
eukprot:4711996-Amphidinium_carterae.1